MKGIDFIDDDELPSSLTLKKQLPLTDNQIKVKQKRDKEIADVFDNKDNRFLLIVGPCAADSMEPVLEYILRLAELQEKVSDHLILIPRVYTNKPRTDGKGYKGMGYQPDLHEGPNILQGLCVVRNLHREVLNTKLTAADEMLYPSNYPYLDDILGYVAIGARSVENQEHRLMSSAVNVPVGMKNPISGDLTVMMNSIGAAMSQHALSYDRRHGMSKGNKYAHAILRGYNNKYGHSFPNYHYEDIERVLSLFRKWNINNPSIIVDCSHSNSSKNYKRQPRIAKEVLHHRIEDKEMKKAIKGLMMESYLKEGSQLLDSHIKGKSYMDPCLGWEDTEKIIYDIAKIINKTT